MESVPAAAHRGRSLQGVMLMASTLIFAACGGGGKYLPSPSTSSLPTIPSPPAGGATLYTVGGSVSGVSGAGLTLQNNGGDNLAIGAGSTAFTFATSIANGAAYTITVLTQPANPSETCTIANGIGTVSGANVSNIVVTCAAIAPPASSDGLSSFDKIDAAVAAGQLSAETALIYKVYAVYGDARLPAEFMGNDDGIIDVPVMDQIATRFDALSPKAQQLLGPFLLRPNVAGSWATPSAAASVSNSLKIAQVSPSSTRPPCQFFDSGSWTYEERSGVPIRVWYQPADAATAVDLADEIRNRIWPAFVSLNGLGAPLPVDDTGSGNPLCFGGDGKLDIYLVTMTGGLTTPEGDPNGGPVFITVKRDHAHIHEAVAHEIMHAVQWAVKSHAPQDSYGWMRDAMANWAMDMVYGKDQKHQFEETYADCYTGTPELSLDDGSTGHCKTQTKKVSRNYGAYLYFQYLVRSGGGNAVVAQILNAMSSTDDGLKAVDAVRPFKDFFPGFAKILWNQDPVNVKNGLDGFKVWDDLELVPETFDHIVLPVAMNGQSNATRILEGNIKHLAIHYFHFSVVDSNVRSLIFYNHPYAIAPIAKFRVSTQAFFKIGGTWDYAHWSQKGKDDEAKFYCLDVKAERLEEFVIAISNDSIDQDITNLPQQPRLSYSNVGCWEFKGTTSVNDDVTDSVTHTISQAQTTDVVFRNVRYATTPPKPPTTPGEETFAVIGGTVDGHKTETESSCTYSSLISKNPSDPSLSASLPTNDASSLDVTLGLTNAGGVTSRAVSGTGTSFMPTHVSVECSGIPPQEHDENDSWDWLEFPGSAEKSVVAGPSGSITDSFTRPYKAPQAGNRTMNWDLKPQREQ